MDQQQEGKHGGGSSSSRNRHLDDIRRSMGNESNHETFMHDNENDTMTWIHINTVWPKLNLR